MTTSDAYLSVPEHTAPQDCRDLREALFRALRSWLEAQDLTQRVIAAKLQISRSCVSDIRRGECRMTAERLAELWVATGGSWQLKLSLPPGSTICASGHSPLPSNRSRGVL